MATDSFFHLMNMGGVNALNIFKSNKNDWKISRKQSLRELAFELMEPAIRRRVVMDTLPKEIRRRGNSLLSIQEEPPVPRERPVGVGKCYLCGRARNKSTRKTC